MNDVAAIILIVTVIVTVFGWIFGAAFHQIELDWDDPDWIFWPVFRVRNFVRSRRQKNEPPR